MIKVNAVGDVCPIPVVKAKIVLKEADINDLITVIVDNEISLENLEKMATEMGYDYKRNVLNGNHFEIEITKGNKISDALDKIKNEDNKYIYDKRETVVVISSEKMGDGDEQLGKTLMKAFFYSLTEIENFSGTIIFYNGGVNYTVSGSPVLEDLKKLEDRGIEVLSCGACLNFYGLTERLLSGNITNMYSILEKMNNAQKIIKP